MTAPEGFSGLVARYKASSLTGLVAGDPISSVTDSSGNGYTATQATSASRPTYQVVGGRPVMRFDGVDDFLQSSMPLTGSAVHVFFIGTLRSTTTSVAARYYSAYNSSLANDHDNTSAFISHRNSGTNHTMHRAGATRATGAVTANTPFVGTSLMDNIDAGVWVNGTLGTAASYSPGALSTNGFLIGASWVSSTQGDFSDLDVYEILVYSRKLATSTEQAQVHSYAQDTYGITVSDYDSTWNPAPAVSYVASSAAVIYSALNGASVAPTYPAGMADGDYAVMFVAQKPTSGATSSGTATVTTPSGWTLLGSLGSSLTTPASGGDAGPTKITAFGREVTAANSGATVTVTIAGSDVAWAHISAYRRNLGSSGAWSVAAATGEDTSGNASYSATMSTNPGITVGDHVLGALIIPTDVTTPAQFTAEALAATGATFAAATEIVEPDTGTGTDAGGVIWRTSCTAGTATAAPVFTTTAAGTVTNVYGPSVIVRLREVTLGLSQAVTDSVAVADAAAAARGIVSALTDAVAVADSASAAVAYARGAVDAVGVADAAATAQAYVVSLADSVALADVAAGAFTLAAAAADTVPVADAATAASAVARALVDTLTVTDTASAVSDVARSAADTVAVADAVGTFSDAQRAAGDAVGVADAVSGAVDRAVTLADTVAVADAVSGAAQGSAVLADAVGVADAVTAVSDVARAQADAVAVADATTAVAARVVALSDTLAVADTAATAAQRSTSVADAVAVTDGSTAAVSYAATVADTVAVTDTAAARSDVSRTVTDSLAVEDDALPSSQSAGSASFADSIPISDDVTASAVTVVPLADAVGVADGVAAARSLAVSLSDAVAVADAAATAGDGGSALADAVGVVDEITVALARVVTVADFLALTDATTPALVVGGVALSRDVADGLAVADAAASILVSPLALTVSLADTVAVVDVATVAPSGVVVPGDFTATLTAPSWAASLTADTWSVSFSAGSWTATLEDA